MTVDKGVHKFRIINMLGTTFLCKQYVFDRITVNCYKARASKMLVMHVYDVIKNNNVTIVIQIFKRHLKQIYYLCTKKNSR